MEVGLFQADMLSHDSGYRIETHGSDHLFTDKSVIAPVLDCFCFSNVMKQTSGLNQIQIQFRELTGQVFPEENGNPGHLKAVVFDIREHAMLFHQRQAGFAGRNEIVHRNFVTNLDL